MAAVPAVGGLEATDIQGVSALLKGEVDPAGEATVYRFEYVDQASFAASGFANAAVTPVTPVAAAAPHPARAALAGLVPDTTYRYRLTATQLVRLQRRRGHLRHHRGLRLPAG